MISLGGQYACEETPKSFTHPCQLVTSKRVGVSVQTATATATTETQQQ